MKITRKETKQIEEEIFVAIKCDKCNIEYNDPFEVQEFHHIDFVGGYGSIFGDMTRITADICQHCLRKMIDGIFQTEDVGFY